MVYQLTLVRIKLLIDGLEKRIENILKKYQHKHNAIVIDKIIITQEPLDVEIKYYIKQVKPLGKKHFEGKSNKENKTWNSTNDSY